MSRRRFTFQLAGVLRARRLQERAAERELTGARQRVVEAGEACRRREAAVDEALCRAASGRRPGRVEMQVLLNGERVIAEEEMRVVAAREKESQALASLAEAQSSLAEAARARKALELLEQAARERHTRQERRAEERAMDEAAIVRFGGRQR